MKSDRPLRAAALIACLGVISSCDSRNQIETAGYVNPPQPTGKRPPKDLTVEQTKPGAGPEAKKGDFVQVMFRGWLVDSYPDQTFETSYAVVRDGIEHAPAKGPYRFKLGAGQVIEGWDRGIVGMRVGERRKLTVPPWLAYGDRGAGGLVPANATLIFEIELVAIGH